MKNSYDILALCLTAEEHPYLKEEPEFQEALAQVDASAELKKQLEDARAFFAEHPRLMEVSQMPSDVRDRIASVLEVHQPHAAFTEEQVLGPWEVRRNFAWAACLVLLLACVAVFSSAFMEQQAERQRRVVLSDMPPQDAFRTEIGRLVSRAMPLQNKSQDASQLISWLGEQGVSGIQPPKPLMDQPAMGCARFQTPFGTIAVLCFKVEDGVVHLFVADAREMGLEHVHAPRSFQLRGRPVKEWSDEKNLYLLVPQEPDMDLPEIFL